MHNFYVLFYKKRYSFKTCSIYPHFLHLWTVLKIISNHYFPARTRLLEKLGTFSWMTKPQKRRTDLFQYICSILQNDKDTKRKTFWLKKLVPLYYITKTEDKSTLLPPKISSIIISENLINILINPKNTKRTSCHSTEWQKYSLLEKSWFNYMVKIKFKKILLLG